MRRLPGCKKTGVRSVLGNTDKKIRALLQGKTIKKPRKEEKKVMYAWTAENLTPENRRHLLSLPDSFRLSLEGKGADKRRSGAVAAVFHGSPADGEEFLFADTPEGRFRELAALTPASIVIVGHSHTPFHKRTGDTHFINPGSVGRMFDGNPAASCATLTLDASAIRVAHHRIPYRVEEVISGLRRQKLPAIYDRMYREGRKLN